MQLNIWIEISLGVGSLTIVALIFALPIGYFFCKLDADPKDGPRCRKCGYDLRESYGEACSECGASLSPCGVWPIGKPSRKSLVLSLTIWSWLCASLTVVAILLYNRHDLDIVQKRIIHNDLFYVDWPRSGSYTLLVGSAGSDWQFFPNLKEPRVAAQQITVHIASLDVGTDECVFDINSLKVQAPIDSQTQSFAESNYGPTMFYYANDAEDDLTQKILSSMQSYNPSSITSQDVQKQAREEAKAIIELAVRLCRNRTLTTTGGLADSESKLVQESLVASGFFGEARDFRRETLDIVAPPAWVVYFVPAFGFIVWLTGAISIRRAVYARQTASGL